MSSIAAFASASPTKKFGTHVIPTLHPYGTGEFVFLTLKPGQGGADFPLGRVVDSRPSRLTVALNS